MTEGYFQHWLNGEKRKAVSIIRQGRHVPSDTLKAIIGAEATVKKTLLNDVDYMRWVNLHSSAHFSTDWQAGQTTELC